MNEASDRVIDMMDEAGAHNRHFRWDHASILPDHVAASGLAGGMITIAFGDDATYSDRDDYRPKLHTVLLHSHQVVPLITELTLALEQQRAKEES